MQSHHATRMLHRVNLESVGGVEVSFAHFLRSTGGLQPTHQVLVHDDIHPLFEPVLSASRVRPIRRTQAKRWHGLPLPHAARRLRAKRIARLLRPGTPDLVLAWNNFANSELVALARVLRRPLVYYEHGNGWRGGRGRERGAGDFLAATSGVICNSRASTRMLQLLWGYRAEPALVYCAIGHGFDAPVPDRQAAAPRPVRLGVAGRLIPLKGVSLTIFALAALRDEHGVDAELHIAGTGPAEASLRTLADRLGLSRQVVFHGLVSDMRAFYDAVDVQLVPSLREPFGRVSIEAQARGCPVVVAGVDGLVETVGSGASGRIVAPTLPLSDYVSLGGSEEGIPNYVYDPQSDALTEPRVADPSNLASAVADICRDSATFDTFAATARAHVLDRFSQERYAQNLISALNCFAGRYADARSA